MKRSARRIDELRHFFLAENGGQAMSKPFSDRECRQCSTASSASGCRKTAGHTDGSSPYRATTSALRRDELGTPECAADPNDREGTGNIERKLRPCEWNSVWKPQGTYYA